MCIYYGCLLSYMNASVAAHARALVNGAKTLDVWDDQVMEHEAKCEEKLILEAASKKALGKIRNSCRTKSVTRNV